MAVPTANASNGLLPDPGALDVGGPEATDQGNKIATSQIALPADACDQVFATDGYEQSVSNLQQVSLDSDNVFGEDGGTRQLGTITGSVDAGYIVELATPVNLA